MTVTAHISVLLIFLSALSAINPATAWVSARATYYGRDGWSIHTGACGYGFLCPNKWSGELREGEDITAISDRSPLYKGCGKCLEVKCRSADFSDYFGNRYQRTGICKSDHVKVKITDVCPCHFPDNATSNKRWCCGDMPHLDMSEWAIAKITENHQRWGVFAISYRQISCNAHIQNEAPNASPGSKLSDPYTRYKPSNLRCGSSGGSSPHKTPHHKKHHSKPHKSPKHHLSKHIKPGKKHSAFYNARKRAYAHARKYRNHSKGFWKRMARKWYG